MYSVDQYREVIKCGFLVKSPPFIESQNGRRRCLPNLTCGKGHPRLFRKRWRERYCVLYKIRFRDKTEIFFEYYKDSQCSRLKGRVDLENCDCITDHVPVGKWSNVFSVQTLHNGQKRVYYFAAPNQQNMWDWVRHLVDITGFVPETSEQTPVTQTVHSVAVVTDSYQREKLLSPAISHPFQSVAATVNSSWLTESNVCSGTDVTHPQMDDGYRDPLAPEMEYLLSGPEDEHDGYYRLPGLSHSYVNLTANTDKPERSSLPGASKDYPSCPHLATIPADSNPVDSTVCSPLRPLKVTTNCKPSSIENGLKLSCELDTTNPRKRDSKNSLYFNVWEAGNGGEVDDYTLGPSADLSGQPLSPPDDCLQRDNISVPNRQIPARVFRRSQLISEYHQLPLPPPVSAHPSLVNHPVPVHRRKPDPPRRSIANTKIASATLPPSITKPLPPIGDRSLGVSTVNTDLDLPVRVSGSGDVGDSSIDSITDSFSSSSDLRISESMVNDAPTETAPPCPSDGSARAATYSPNEMILRPVYSQSRDPSTLSEASRPSKLLNYIEPCNLDLCSVSSNPHPIRSGLPARSTVAPTNVAHSLSSGTVLVSNNNSNNLSCNQQNTSDDYKTEYKEIDPIGTNALAVVTKRYLDDDVPT